MTDSVSLSLSLIPPENHRGETDTGLIGVYNHVHSVQCANDSTVQIFWQIRI